MKTGNEVKYEAALQRISEVVGAPFPSDAETVVKAVDRKVAEEWNAAIEAAAKLLEARGARIRGAVNPDKAAAEIRALKREAK